MANQHARAKDLHVEAHAQVHQEGRGKFISAQARVLWSQEERVHTRLSWATPTVMARRRSRAPSSQFQQQGYFEGLRFDKGEYSVARANRNRCLR